MGALAPIFKQIIDNRNSDTKGVRVAVILM